MTLLACDKSGNMYKQPMCVSYRSDQLNGLGLSITFDLRQQIVIVRYFVSAVYGICLWPFVIIIPGL